MSDDLLELQRIDTTTDQLAHRRANLPERAGALDAGTALGAVERRRAEVTARDAELEAAVAALERDGADVAAHRTRLEAQLRTVVAPREAEALLHEIDTLARRRDELDDAELAHLDEQAALAAELADLDGRRPGLESAAASARAELAAAEAAIDAEMAALAAGRTEVLVRLDPGLLERYERLRARMGGVAVARLDGSRCGGCHLDLSPVERDEVRAGRSGGSADLADCPQCGRMLVA